MWNLETSKPRKAHQLINIGTVNHLARERSTQTTNRYNSKFLVQFAHLEEG